MALRFLTLLISVFGLCLLFTSSALADDSSLNQIKFDGEVKENTRTATRANLETLPKGTTQFVPHQLLKAIYEQAQKNRAGINSSAKGAVAPIPDKMPSRARLRRPGEDPILTNPIWEKGPPETLPGEEIWEEAVTATRIDLEGDKAFVIPRLRGPLTDTRGGNKITSVKAWPKVQNSCGKLEKARDFYDKSSAIREVLHRLTGSDALSDILCTKPCTADYASSKLVGLALFNANNFKFKMVEKDELCHYELSKPAEENWQMLTASYALCACLPRY